MSILPGTQTDYSFRRNGNKFVIIRNADSVVVKESTNDFSVEFSDGSTVDLSQRLDNLAAGSDSLYFAPPPPLPSRVAATCWYGNTMASRTPDAGEGEGEGVTLQHYDASGKLLKETLLVSGEAEDPSVTATPDGGYIVAWSTESGSTSSVRIHQFNPDGTTKGGVQTVTSSKSAELEDAVVSVLSNGDYVVSWVSAVEKNDGETGDLYQQFYSVSGRKIGAAQKINTCTITGSVPDDQIILLLDDGGFLIAYTHETATHGQWGNFAGESKLYLRALNPDAPPPKTPSRNCCTPSTPTIPTPPTTP